MSAENLLLKKLRELVCWKLFYISPG